MAQHPDRATPDRATPDRTTPDRTTPDRTTTREPSGARGRSIDPAAGHGGPWAVIRRQQDRRRYLRVLTPRRVGRERIRLPDPATGVARSSHVLTGAPATVIRTSAHYPDPADVRHYLEHSCDVTMRGGAASTVAYPLAVCALAEHYVLRRVGGASGGAAMAAASAAAELGRGAPDPAYPPPDLGVVPGFAGLATIAGWLAGSGADDGVETWRLTRLFQPSDTTRSPFRLLAAMLRRPYLTRAQRLYAPLAAVVGGLGRQSKAVMLMVWAGFGLGGIGMITSQLRAARATPDASVSLALLTGAALAVALLMAALLASLLVYVLGTLQLLRTEAEESYFGLVPGVRPPPGTPEPRAWQMRISAALDRWSGVPEPGEVPPLVDWLADRIDDLAGVDAPPGEVRHALTFGDLWLGEIRARTADDDVALRRMAADPQQRVVDLALVATNLSQRRPHRLPFPAADDTERTGAVRYLFCAACLDDVLPARVVAQLVRDSPSLETEHPCPRHGGVGRPRHEVHRVRDTRLRELPDPWDLPVVVATRLSMATPGLLRAVPLYALETSRPRASFDEWGARLPSGSDAGNDIGNDIGTDAGSDTGASAGRVAVRTHWFCDGGVTSNVPITFFDTLLPRWPTFGLTVSPVPDDAPDEMLDLPPQDASTHRSTWREIGAPAAFAAALVGAGLDWRDTLQAELPGFRGRVASVRQAPSESTNPLFLPSADVLHLALRGYHAGRALRERFTGPDLAPYPDPSLLGQTQTDRHRWIRMRTAVRELRRMSQDLGARMPLYGDLAASYRVPAELTGWFDPPLQPGERDRAWADEATAVTTLRAMSTGGMLDFDAEDGTPPLAADLGISPPE